MPTYYTVDKWINFVHAPCSLDPQSIQLDPSAAELSRRRRKMVTHRISAETRIRPGDRRRRKKIRRLAKNYTLYLIYQRNFKQ